MNLKDIIKNNQPKPLGFWGALFILFLGLKLANIITWHWVWVAAPLWAPFALGLALGTIYLGVDYAIKKNNK